MKIIVDAFGGDKAPYEILKGCEEAVAEYGVSVLLTGDEDVIRRVVAQHGISLQNIEIQHASSVMPVEAEPTEVMKSYANSSLAVGLKLLSEGKGDAFVSAGSTGALVVGSSFLVGRIKGVKRACIATCIPTMDGFYMLADAGANAECRPEMFLQFAILCSVYMNRVMKVEKPRVALINIGAEETKGTQLQLDAYELLKTAPVNFTGNVEPRSLPFGECDVAIADGFTGNVVLKLTEGMGSALSKQIKGIFMRNTLSKIAALLVKGGITDFKKKMDYTEYGGAPLLGISKPVIKAHGSSNAKAIKNAIRQAKEFCEQDVIGEVQKTLISVKEQKKKSESAAPAGEDA